MSVRLVLESDEYALVDRLWAWLKSTGHADCGGFYRDGRDPLGYMRCYCGEAIAVPAVLPS